MDPILILVIFIPAFLVGYSLPHIAVTVGRFKAKHAIASLKTWDFVKRFHYESMGIDIVLQQKGSDFRVYNNLNDEVIPHTNDDPEYLEVIIDDKPFTLKLPDQTPKLSELQQVGKILGLEQKETESDIVFANRILDYNRDNSLPLSSTDKQTVLAVYINTKG